MMADTAADFSINGMKRRLPRPKDGEKQEKDYSGKKKTHTYKNLVLVNNLTKKVLYLSPTVSGQTHDKKIADENPINYPTRATFGKDTGFQGYKPPGVKIFQPKKRTGVEPSRQMVERHHFWSASSGRKLNCRHQTMSDCQIHYAQQEGRLFRFGNGDSL
jgi:hypothetical protein